MNLHARNREEKEEEDQKEQQEQEKEQAEEQEQTRTRTRTRARKKRKRDTYIHNRVRVFQPAKRAMFHMLKHVVKGRKPLLLLLLLVVVIVLVLVFFFTPFLGFLSVFSLEGWKRLLCVCKWSTYLHKHAFMPSLEKISCS